MERTLYKIHYRVTLEDDSFMETKTLFAAVSESFAEIYLKLYVERVYNMKPDSKIEVYDIEDLGQVII